jgi:N-acyl-D-aspartate/D-glutamate deacylase
MAMFDLIIRNGSIVDGTGRRAFDGDVAVAGGRIVEIGRVSGGARQQIDADGRLVTPGFVDPHAHYDGQVTWDDKLAPSFGHGVTTVVMGNCGVGFAPVRPDGASQAQLIDLMEGVEDIPGSVLHEGMDWTWESFPGYLDALEGRTYSMDVGAQVPHGALRTYVMGERAVEHLPATGDEIAEMARLCGEAVCAGALGFSTSRILGHQSTHGSPVPGTFAANDEMFAIGRAVAAAGGVFELVPGGSVGDNGLAPGEEAALSDEMAWMETLSRDTGMPITFLMFEFDSDPEAFRHALRFTEQANARGARLLMQVAGRPTGLLTGWQARHLFQRRPMYMKLAELPLAERIRELRRPEVRAAILSEADIPPTSAALMDNLHQLFARCIDAIYPLGNPVDYEPTREQSVSSRAARRGVSAEEQLYDLMCEDDGRAMLLQPNLNYSRGNHDSIYEMLNHPHSLLGLADGGAHCSLICDASTPTYMLTHWVRDRTRGPRLELEHVVKKLTDEPADLYGLSDRGTLEVGKRADLNVIDLDALALPAPHLVHDLPAGGPRLLQEASGYAATVVAGTITLRDDQDTGERPGRLLRGRR